jgi:hypothetical protein
MQVLLAACTLSFLSSVHVAHAAPAALVEFAIGNVNAVNTAGVSRSLNKGAEVQAGDTIDTGTGRAQLRFSDGAYISLQPGSQFRIDEYNYAGKSDDSERGFFSLIKGGMRTITGLIGRSNRRNYQVRVPVATIGIRGTEYTLLFDGVATGSVGEGAIAVCNGAGCLDVTSGQSYVVTGPNTAPVLTSVRTSLPAPPPPGSLPQYSVTNDVTSTGLPVALATAQPFDDPLFGDQHPTGTGPQGGTPRPITTQPGTLALAMSSFPGVLNDLPFGDRSDVKTASVDVESGKLVSWTYENVFNQRGPAGLVDHRNLGQIAWGRFNSGTLGPPPDPSVPPPSGGTFSSVTLSDRDSLHYVVAKEMPAINLPTTGTFVFKFMDGGTTPTTSMPPPDHPKNATPILASASLTVDFDAHNSLFLGTAIATVSVKLYDNSITSFVNAGAGIPTGQSNFHGIAASRDCTNCTGGDFSGVMAAPDAHFAGFTYGIDGTTFGKVRGAVVLHR